MIRALRHWWARHRAMRACRIPAGETRTFNARTLRACVLQQLVTQVLPDGSGPVLVHPAAQNGPADYFEVRVTNRNAKAVSVWVVGRAECGASRVPVLFSMVRS